MPAKQARRTIVVGKAVLAPPPPSRAPPPPPPPPPPPQPPPGDDALRAEKAVTSLQAQHHAIHRALATFGGERSQKETLATVKGLLSGLREPPDPRITPTPPPKGKGGRHTARLGTFECYVQAMLPSPDPKPPSPALLVFPDPPATLPSETENAVLARWASLPSTKLLEASTAQPHDNMPKRRATHPIDARASLGGSAGRALRAKVGQEEKAPQRKEASGGKGRAGCATLLPVDVLATFLFPYLTYPSCCAAEGTCRTWRELIREGWYKDVGLAVLIQTVEERLYHLSVSNAAASRAIDDSSLAALTIPQQVIMYAKQVESLDTAYHQMNTRSARIELKVYLHTQSSPVMQKEVHQFHCLHAQCLFMKVKGEGLVPILHKLEGIMRVSNYGGTTFCDEMGQGVVAEDIPRLAKEMVDMRVLNDGSQPLPTLSRNTLQTAGPDCSAEAIGRKQEVRLLELIAKVYDYTLQVVQALHLPLSATIARAGTAVDGSLAQLSATLQSWDDCIGGPLVTRLHALGCRETRIKVMFVRKGFSHVMTVCSEMQRILASVHALDLHNLPHPERHQISDMLHRGVADLEDQLRHPNTFSPDSKRDFESLRDRAQRQLSNARQLILQHKNLVALHQQMEHRVATSFKGIDLSLPRDRP